MQRLVSLNALQRTRISCVVDPFTQIVRMAGGGRPGGKPGIFFTIESPKAINMDSTQVPPPLNLLIH
jgi:hypothetical protein